MAASNSLRVLLTTSLTFFLLLLSHRVSSVSFSFDKFTPGQPNLILQADALVSSQGELRLTKPVGNSLGRALYAPPVRIWDSATGYVGSFVTSFDFVIHAPNKATAADGLAFFLAAVDSQPGEKGGFLGLFRDATYNKANQVVAFEFDTFVNKAWDPSSRHIGLDVNTIKSVKTVPWDFPNGEVGTAIVTYRGDSQRLVASVVYPSRQTSYILTASVNLMGNLPEWVRIGFSATTGRSQAVAETHDVLSWSFTSSFDDEMKDSPHLASYVPHDFM